jgi:transketolase
VRNAFADELTKLTAHDRNIVLLSGDIGNKLFEGMKAIAPDNVINMGVAEANMVGVGAGMAMCGMKPIAYTITPFVTTRCLEQIRDDLGYHDLPVLLVGVGAGLGYATLGPTHHSCEDISFLRSIPGMTVLAPGDPHEVRALLREALKLRGPAYMRIGKKGEPLVHPKVPDLTIGKAYPIFIGRHQGRGVCILNTGNTLPLAMEVAHELDAKGIPVQMVQFHTVKPLDTHFLASAFSKFSSVVTIEEHSLIGGFGSAVAEWQADHLSGKPGAKLIRFGTRDEFMHVVGEQEFAREHFGLTKEKIIERVMHEHRS